MSRKRHVLMIRLLAIFLVLFSVNVFARPVTITYEGVASGSLDGVSFTNVAFKIVANADTRGLERRPPPSCFQRVVHQSTTVALEGLGKFRFLTDDVGGYSSILNGTALSVAQFDEGDDFFDYDLVGVSGGVCNNSVEPYVSNLLTSQTLSGSMFVAGWGDGESAGPVMTDGGRLVFDDVLSQDNQQGSRTVSYPPAQPVPAMPIHFLFAFAGLLALFGFSRVRASK